MQEIELVPFSTIDSGHIYRAERRFLEKELDIEIESIPWTSIRKFRELYQSMLRKQQFSNFDTPLTFGKIFRWRRKHRENLYYRMKRTRRLKRFHWMITIPGEPFPLVYRTKKEAIRAMEIGHGWYSHFYQNLTQVASNKRIEIPIGSYLWCHDLSQANDDNTTWKNFEKNYPVHTKRCASCPNKRSYQGQCACSFWSAIKSETQVVNWIPPHEAKMARKKALKRSVVENPSVRIVKVLI